MEKHEPKKSIIGILLGIDENGSCVFGIINPDHFLHTKKKGESDPIVYTPDLKFEEKNQIPPIEEL